MDGSMEIPGGVCPAQVSCPSMLQSMYGGFSNPTVRVSGDWTRPLQSVQATLTASSVAKRRLRRTHTSECVSTFLSVEACIFPLLVGFEDDQRMFGHH